MAAMADASVVLRVTPTSADERFHAKFVLDASQKRPFLMKITTVESGSLAEAAGLEVDDVVLAIAGTSIDSSKLTAKTCMAASGEISVQCVAGRTTTIRKDGRLGMSLFETGGVLAASVQKDGLAGRCGLRDGDQILSINNQPCMTRKAEGNPALAQSLLAAALERGGELSIEVRVPRPREAKPRSPSKSFLPNFGRKNSGRIRVDVNLSGADSDAVDPSERGLEIEMDSI
jgi:predicted metalloprotease with PDZ domain